MAKFYKSLPEPNELALKKIGHLYAFEVVGEEYGLIHQKQPDGYVQDHDDVWLEKVNDKYVSYITCSDKIIKTDVPHCKHYIFFSNNMSLTVTYNKILFTSWKEIRNNVIEMFESFEDEHSACEYINQKLNKIKTRQCRHSVCP